MGHFVIFIILSILRMFLHRNHALLCKDCMTYYLMLHLLKFYDMINLSVVPKLFAIETKTTTVYFRAEANRGRGLEARRKGLILLRSRRRRTKSRPHHVEEYRYDDETNNAICNSGQGLGGVGGSMHCARTQPLKSGNSNNERPIKGELNSPHLRDVQLKFLPFLHP